MKESWAAPERNKQIILKTLRPLLPASGTVLEVASGTGQHICHFAQALPNLRFQPTDLDPVHRASVDAWGSELGLSNLAKALTLDTTAEWPLAQADALYCANMIHIAPWAAAEGLFAGAGRVLSSGSPFFLYGPFRIEGQDFAESNARFDGSLKERNPDWGIRALANLDALAKAAGMVRENLIALPANNHLIVFRKA